MLGSVPRVLPRAAGILVALGVSWSLGCGEAEPPPRNDEVPRELSWEAVAGANAYRVQAWSGHRLIFEETVRDTLLALGPAIVRTMAAFDSVSAEVRAEGPDGVISIQRQRLEP